LWKISKIQTLLDDGPLGQFSRFVQVGVANTIGTYLLYLALIQVLSYVVSYSIGFVVGVLVSACFNARYSFSTRLNRWTLTRFVVMYIISFNLSVQLLIFCVEQIDLHAKIAPLVVLAVFAPINFMCSRVALTGRWRRPQ
jgi:putative flippase GtrA